MADVIVIDEAHHFRNTGVRAESEDERQSRYWQLFDICAGQAALPADGDAGQQPPDRPPAHDRTLLPADAGHFKGAPLGIHSLPGHFRKLEKELEASMGVASGSARRREADTDEAQVEKVLGRQGALPRDRRAAQPQLRPGEPEEARRASRPSFPCAKIRRSSTTR